MGGIDAVLGDYGGPIVCLPIYRGQAVCVSSLC